ncbi:RFC checkpoint protein Rad17 [Umbelopsis sp. WA50703]
MGSSLWSDKYTPRTEQDLAITPAKVKSVRTWINDSLATGTQNGNKLLIMSGPSGCGKSTTVRTLARTMDFDIQEWTTFGSTAKWDDLVDKQDYESLMTNFIDYLTRSLRHDRTIQSSTNHLPRARRKVVLIDDIPDLTYGTSRKRFHDLMRGICRQNDSHVPVILTLTTLEESRGSEPRGGAKKNTLDFADNGIIPTDISQSNFCTKIQWV